MLGFGGAPPCAPLCPLRARAPVHVPTLLISRVHPPLPLRCRPCLHDVRVPEGRARSRFWKEVVGFDLAAARGARGRRAAGHALPTLASQFPVFPLVSPSGRPWSRRQPSTETAGAPTRTQGRRAPAGAGGHCRPSPTRLGKGGGRPAREGPPSPAPLNGGSVRLGPKGRSARGESSRGFRSRAQTPRPAPGAPGQARLWHSNAAGPRPRPASEFVPNFVSELLFSLQTPVERAPWGTASLRKERLGFLGRKTHADS